MEDRHIGEVLPASEREWIVTVQGNPPVTVRAHDEDEARRRGLAALNVISSDHPIGVVLASAAEADRHAMEKRAAALRAELAEVEKRLGPAPTVPSQRGPSAIDLHALDTGDEGLGEASGPPPAPKAGQPAGVPPGGQQEPGKKEKGGRKQDKPTKQEPPKPAVNVPPGVKELAPGDQLEFPPLADKSAEKPPGDKPPDGKLEGNSGQPLKG
jgi:hypothetical protein